MTLEENLTRPPECCGKCPPTTTGYDCTCAGNPRCEGPNRGPSVTIPDEAVEAAAKAMYEQPPRPQAWRRGQYAAARAVLEAALPWLQATKNGGDQ